MNTGKNTRGGGDHGGGHDSAGGMRWLLTYADMITLLLALFIYLYSISTVSAAKFQAFTESFVQIMGLGKKAVTVEVLSGGTGVLPVPGNRPPHREKPPPPPQEDQETPADPETNRKALSDLDERLREEFPDLFDQQRLVLIEQDEGLVLRLQETTLFELGKAGVTEQAEPILAMIASHLRELPNPIRVEGHTDDLPIRGGNYRSNWELSGARAASVVQDFIMRGGIPPERLSLAGYGEFRPLTPNVPGQGNPQNRRVEIVVLAQSLTPQAALP